MENTHNITIGLLLLAIAAILLVSCGDASRKASAAIDMPSATAMSGAIAPSQSLTAIAMFPGQQSPLNVADVEQIQPSVHRQGPGSEATSTPGRQRYTSREGLVSFEYPENWILTVNDQTDRYISLHLDSPMEIGGEIKCEDMVRIRISNVSRDERKHYAPWNWQVTGNTSYGLGQNDGMGWDYYWLTPAYVTDAEGFVYVLAQWVVPSERLADEDMPANVSAVLYNMENEILVQVTGGRFDYALKEKANDYGLLNTIQDRTEHRVFLNLVDSLIIGESD